MLRSSPCWPRFLRLGCDDHYLGRAQLTTTGIFSPLFQGFYGPLNQTQRTFKCLQSSCFHLTIANTSEDFLLELPLPGRHLLWLRLYLLATEQIQSQPEQLGKTPFQNALTDKDWGCTSEAEHLPHMQGGPQSLNPPKPKPQQQQKNDS